MGELLRKLQREQEQECQEAARREVQQLVGTPSRPDHLTGFAAACADSKANHVRQQLDRAIEELSSNSHCIDTQLAERDFRATYAAVPSDQLDAIIRKAREG